MIKKLSIVFLLLFFVITLSACSKETEKKVYYFDKEGNMTTVKPMEAEEATADKLEVYYFHRTARCYSCKTIGQYVRETMEEKYSQQIKNGIIDFRELNVELPENKEITQKYKASGSSLFINRIIDDKDDIEQDANVWRLLGDEVKFKSYLENKIDSYLGM